MANQGPCTFKGFDLRVGDFDAGGVGVGVEFGVDGQPGCGGGGVDGLTMTSWLVSGRPRQFIEMWQNKPVLDLVPLACAGRQMADGDGQPGGRGELGEFDLPQPDPGAVGAAAVGADQQLLARRVAGRPIVFHQRRMVSTANCGGVVVGAYADPAGVRGDVVHPVRVDLAQVLVEEVVDVRPARAPPSGCHSRPPFLNCPDQFLLLRVDADHRVPGVQVPGGLLVEVPELGVPVRMLSTLEGLGVAPAGCSRAALSNLRTTNSDTW